MKKKKPKMAVPDPHGEVHFHIHVHEMKDAKHAAKMQTPKKEFAPMRKPATADDRKHWDNAGRYIGFPTVEDPTMFPKKLLRIGGAVEKE
jgi:hypothetical protein